MSHIIMKNDAFNQHRSTGYIWTSDTLELICGDNNNEPEQIGKQGLEMLGRVRNERILYMTSNKHKKYVIRSLRKGETDLPEGSESDCAAALMQRFAELTA